MARLDTDGRQVLIQAPPSPRLPVVMKRLQARRAGPLWCTPAHRALDVVDALHHAVPERSDAFEDLEYRLRNGGDPDHVHACLALKRGLEHPGDMPAMRKPLYPYQEQAVAFLDRCKAGILADEPGLGKTLQGIAFALLADGPALIVCPATAKHVWEREIEDSCEADVQVLSGRGAQVVGGARFIIVNYDILADHAEALAQHGFSSLIADEVHRCKNIQAMRTQALIQVADAIPRKALLSGTLMMNSAEDLFPPLRIVRPEVYPDFRGFCERYMTTRSIRKRVKGRWRKQTVRVASRNLPDLHHRMDPFMIRRTLADVRDQLPELRHTVMAIDLPDDLIPAYKAAHRPLRALRDPMAAMHQAQTALEVCLQAKARILPELIEDRLAAERKLLVFSTRLMLLDAASRDLHEEEWVRIDGQVPTATRRGIEDRFQQEPLTRVFLGQTRACSEALTLDAADTVVIAEADWSPQANEQAVRRAMRVNTGHPVEVVWLVVKGTLDEARMEVLQRKRDEFTAVMEGEVLQEALRRAT